MAEWAGEQREGARWGASQPVRCGRFSLEKTRLCAQGVIGLHGELEALRKSIFSTHRCLCLVGSRSWVASRLSGRWKQRTRPDDRGGRLPRGEHVRWPNDTLRISVLVGPATWPLSCVYASEACYLPIAPHAQHTDTLSSRTSPSPHCSPTPRIVRWLRAGVSNPWLA